MSLFYQFMGLEQARLGQKVRTLYPKEGYKIQGKIFQLSSFFEWNLVDRPGENKAGNINFITTRKH